MTDLLGAIALTLTFAAAAISFYWVIVLAIAAVVSVSIYWGEIQNWRLRRRRAKEDHAKNLARAERYAKRTVGAKAVGTPRKVKKIIMHEMKEGEPL